MRWPARWLATNSSAAGRSCQVGRSTLPNPGCRLRLLPRGVSKLGALAIRPHRGAGVVLRAVGVVGVLAIRPHRGAGVVLRAVGVVGVLAIRPHQRPGATPTVLDLLAGRR